MIKARRAALVRVGALAALATRTVPAAAAREPLPGGIVVETVVDHRVVAGESLALLSARHGVAAGVLARDNGLGPSAPLRLGQSLRIVARHLLPDWVASGLRDGIVINVAQRMLFRLRDGNVASAYPVAVGRADWPTPTGAFSVVDRQRDKTWYVPRSIQDEMRRNGQRVLTTVPPGPDNPLGRHWIGLSMPGIGIHGTIAPASIYGFRSHGCIRLHADDAAALYDSVALGTPGRIVYQPVLLMRSADGRIWLEAGPDVYRRDSTTIAGLRRHADEAGVADRTDWQRVASVLRDRDARATVIDQESSR